MKFHKAGNPHIITKVSDEHGLVLGWGMVSCEKDAKGNYVPYYDIGETISGVRRRDHIPEAAMLSASLQYAQGGRVAGDVHRTAKAALLKAAEQIADPQTREAALELARNATPPVAKRGSVPFLFPMTSDIAAALDIQTERTGLLVGALPDPDILQKYKTGEYTGFSVGGFRIRDEVNNE